MNHPGTTKADVLVVLTTLVAEGTPVMTLDLCREWKRSGLRPALMTMYSTPDDLSGEFAALGVPIFPMQLPSEGYARYLALVRETIRICQRVRPKAVMSMPFGWHAFVAIGARMAGVPAVAAHVGNYPDSTQATAFLKFKAEVLIGRPFTSTLICCSEYVKEGVETHFAGAHGELAVVYNGVSTDAILARAEAARRARERGSRFSVGMVARLECHKDQDTLMAAVALASKELNIELHLIGDGTRRAELEALAAQLGIRDRALFLGSRRDIPEALGRLDAFVFSAKPDEGLGIALIEAMAARVPIIATDVGACREVFGHDGVGMLVPYRDPVAMAAALVRLSHEGPPAGQLDRAAERAGRVFSTQTMGLRYASHLGLSVSTEDA